ncbi:dihydroneopterin aldolase [Rhodoferax sp.]|uniref:dihydroneopterin aldolase n=1 Tax=Rhodoferax sp. TaxID=50421 RepID=UPI00271CC165|nr:dihydroneopterin aldolase [Rhodoferax sp.]MDO8317692.1 dihydroneopterin aldolase [Rhodoferax sp.]MDP2680656.1 dihydroneopterin aldolase [Rhodoferax sp.]
MEKWIRLLGLRLHVSIGIHDFEKKKPQPYKMDIGLLLDAGYRTYHDAISETVDYDALRSRVSAHLGSRHFNLQETVIQEVIDICFEIDPRIRAVDVSTAKTAVYPDCDAVGLHYQVTRADWQS